MGKGSVAAPCRTFLSPERLREGAPQGGRFQRRSFHQPFNTFFFLLLCLVGRRAGRAPASLISRPYISSFFMASRPPNPDKLPSIDHNGTTVEIYYHHGFSIPNRGPAPQSRFLYAARDSKQERHWRSSLEAITSLIDRNFETASLAELS